MVKFITENPIIKYVFIGVISFFILYLIWKQYEKIIRKQEKEPIFIRKPKNAKKPSKYTNKYIPLPSDGNDYSVSVWLYIDKWGSWRYGEWKHILHKGDKSYKKVQPGVWLHPTKNKIVVRFDRDNKPHQYGYNEDKVYPSTLHNNTIRKHIYPSADATLMDVKQMCDKDGLCQGFTCDVYGDPINNESRIHTCRFPNTNDTENLIDNPSSQNICPNPNIGDYKTGSYIKGEKTTMSPDKNINIINDKTMSNDIDNIPVGRWFHLCIVVTKQATEIFIDGTLRNTTTIESKILQNSGDLWVTQDGGFSGLITQLQYHDKSLTHSEVSSIYSWGPNPWLWPDITNIAKKAIKSVDIDVSVNTTYNTYDSYDKEYEAFNGYSNRNTNINY